MIAEEFTAANPDVSAETIIAEGGVQFEVSPQTGEVTMRSNVKTVDDATRQQLSMSDIEALKNLDTSAGKAVVEALMASHTALDEKTAFSLAKYKLLKTKKYLRQFTVLPLDVPMLTRWLIEQKDAARILEMRDEMIGLVGCWGNVRWAGDPFGLPTAPLSPENPGQGRWLVVDEVGGMLVAAMAERMGTLYAHSTTEISQTTTPDDNDSLSRPLASSNTITLVHPAAQPNLSLLKYFNHNADIPSPNHPLSSHLHTLSWLQLLSPEHDSTYSTRPPSATPEELAAMKSGKRGQYYRKRRRYARTRAIVDAALAGNFDGLVIAASMNPVTILTHLVPLLRGGAPVVVYSPNVEPLTKLADCYSTSRRTAFIQSPPVLKEGESLTNWKGDEDFPLNPTLVIGAGLQTSRVREWQVLPGRTHPLMTSRGGAEGYVFTGTRVIPAEGRVEARGKYNKEKRKKEVEAPPAKKAKVDEVKELKQEVVAEAVVPQDKERALDVEMTQ